jgi:hypothetical protein
VQDKRDSLTEEDLNDPKFIGWILHCLREGSIRVNFAGGFAKGLEVQYRHIRETIGHVPEDFESKSESLVPTYRTTFRAPMDLSILPKCPMENSGTWITISSRVLAGYAARLGAQLEYPRGVSKHQLAAF